MIVLERHDQLDRASYERIARDGEPVSFAPSLMRTVDEGRAAVLAELESGTPAYGVTTGLGYLSRTEIAEFAAGGRVPGVVEGHDVAVGADPAMTAPATGSSGAATTTALAVHSRLTVERLGQ